MDKQDITYRLGSNMDKRFTREELNTKLVEFMGCKRANNWNPVDSIEDVLLCDRRLRELGKYEKMEIDYSLSKEGFQGAEAVGMNVVSVEYFGMYSQSVRGSGEDLNIAIIDACLAYNKDTYKREWSGVIIQDTTKHG
jgi:hypothetical protein